MYNRHPRKAIDHEICSEVDSIQVSTADEKEAMICDLREQYKDKATENIHKAQDCQKKYDAKHDSHHVRYS